MVHNCHHDRAIARVHPVHLMNVEWRQAKFFYIQRVGYFTIYNCVFNFNILPLVVSEILGGPIFKLGGAVPPCTPPSETFFCTSGEYVTMSNGVFNFNFLALLLSEILRGS